MKKQQEDSGNTMFLLVCGMIAVLLIIPAWYANRAGSINGSLLTLAKTQLIVFTPFSEEAHTAWSLIEQTDPAALSWEQVMKALRYSGTWVRWVYIVVLCTLGVASIYMSRTSGLIRRLDMESLLKNNAESYACLRPIVGRGSYLLSMESYDNGFWRIARSPVQFALEHGLLLNKDGEPFTLEQALRRGLAHAELPAYGHARLDEAKTTSVFREQLGAAFTDFEKLKDERKAIASAFLAYAAGNKKDCLHILDSLAVSYTEAHCPVCPVLNDSNFHNTMTTLWKDNQKYLSVPLVKRHTAFELPWFMALLTLARRKGVLASSQFLWLRPLDRPLWYALNQCGGRAAWAEGFAAWAHYAAEEKAGKMLHVPQLNLAVSRFHESLSAQGWLTDMPQLLLSSGFGLDKEVVFAVAEVPKDYDANNDETLHEELV